MGAPGDVDLNADLGEGVTDDEGLLEVITSANVACGFHAGDVPTMRSVCEGAVARGVMVGAQVSYADREHFGRRALDVAPDLLRDQVAEQVGTLEDLARAAGTVVAYVKPHGALYHRVVDDAEQAEAVLAGSGTLPVLGLPGAVVLDRARAAGRLAVPEGFPDRGYTPDGRLVPRGEPGDLVAGADAVAEHAVALARLEGPRAVRSLCVHGDSPGAVDAARAVRRALTLAGARVRAWAPP